MRELIISGKLKPGQRLVESHLAEGLDISRQPIREAFHILELEGLITLVPRKGAWVSEVPLDEVKEIYEVRAMMESFSARLVIPNIDERNISQLESILTAIKQKVREKNLGGVLRLNFEFHRKLIQMTKNRRLIQFYESVVLLMKRYQGVGLTPPLSWKNSFEEHNEILMAIKSRDIQTAERLCREHVLQAGAKVSRRLKSLQMQQT